MVPLEKISITDEGDENAEHVLAIEDSQVIVIIVPNLVMFIFKVLHFYLSWITAARSYYIYIYISFKNYAQVLINHYGVRAWVDLVGTM